MSIEAGAPVGEASMRLGCGLVKVFHSAKLLVPSQEMGCKVV